MELGGNAPFIVFDDAELENAVNIAAAIKFGNCGQICVAANRFFIHEKIYDEFLEKLKEKAKNLKIGYKEDLNYDIGPLITDKSRKRIKNLIDKTVNCGAKIEFGGKILPIDGNWFEPTIITGIDASMCIFHEEIFGPVASIIKFKSDKEVLKQANNTNYGLASYLFTTDKKRITKFINKLNFGEVQVNGIKYDIYLPHGGINESGVGHDCSELALEDYLYKKRVSIAIDK
jgi:succinate-semialdehyde dehydrogenase/glutarate-semialdehyde dehydrogenase